MSQPVRNVRIVDADGVELDSFVVNGGSISSDWSLSDYSQLFGVRYDGDLVITVRTHENDEPN